LGVAGSSAVLEMTGVVVTAGADECAPDAGSRTVEPRRAGG
jgi:hypothetical protein